MKKKAMGILRVALLGIVSLLLGVRLYLWNAETLTGNAMPMPFGWGVSMVLTGSMDPALAVDDLVLVHAQESYEVDDIVVYQDGASLVIHRIISIDGETAVTMGDANNAADDPIAVSAIKGKAVSHIPQIGAAVRFLKSPVGFLLILAAAVVLFELPYLVERKKAEDARAQLKEEIRRLKEDIENTKE